VVRLALLLVGIVLVIGAVVATINGVVDPKDEFYSGDSLTAALRSNCLLGDDVVGTRSYPEFKQDIFRRRHTRRIVFGSIVGARSGVVMSFPGFGPRTLLDAVRFLARATPSGTRLSVYVETDPAWFNARIPLRAFDQSFLSRAAYLLSPWTLKSSLDLMRRSRTLAFKGWQKERIDGSCVIDRGSPSPAWRADGTFTGDGRQQSAAWGGFAFNRLTSIDAALAIAQQHRWRVAGISRPARSPTYKRELSALFAKHGYHWRVRRMPV
jgi:hypothetical protein